MASQTDGQSITCAHCGKAFELVSFRRKEEETGDFQQPKAPRLVKCPHCQWKFEMGSGREDGPPRPRRGRFNI